MCHCETFIGDVGGGCLEIHQRKCDLLIAVLSEQSLRDGQAKRAVTPAKVEDSQGRVRLVQADTTEEVFDERLGVSHGNPRALTSIVTPVVICQHLRLGHMRCGMSSAPDTGKQ